MNNKEMWIIQDSIWFALITLYNLHKLAQAYIYFEKWPVGFVLVLGHVLTSSDSSLSFSCCC